MPISNNVRLYEHSHSLLTQFKLVRYLFELDNLISSRGQLIGFHSELALSLA